VYKPDITTLQRAPDRDSWAVCVSPLGHLRPRAAPQKGILLPCHGDHGPYADEHGDTLAVLHNSDGNLGVSLGFNIQQLPVFSL
jgi:hypothetical protein